MSKEPPRNSNDCRHVVHGDGLARGRLAPHVLLRLGHVVMEQRVLLRVRRGSDDAACTRRVRPRVAAAVAAAAQVGTHAAGPTPRVRLVRHHRAVHLRAADVARALHALALVIACAHAAHVGGGDACGLALEAAATVCIPVSVAVSLSDGQPQKHNLRSGTRV